jgi:cellulose biosynthesis protein BcsQ
MQVISIISTKGGVGKTAVAANLGGFIADAGLRVLLLDLDAQPTLSSYYELTQRASGGIYASPVARNMKKYTGKIVVDWARLPPFMGKALATFHHGWD